MNESEILVFAFVIVWIVEFYLFGMQRASLLISRTSDIDWKSVGVHLLPSWYPITWIVRIAKWSLLVTLFIYGGWQLALACFGISIVLLFVVPIPYRFLYTKTFQRSVARMYRQDPEAGNILKEMLQKSGFAV